MLENLPKKAIIVLFTYLFFTLKGVSVAECLPWQNDFEQRPDLNIGLITIQVNDVFKLENKKEQTWFHSTLNYLHINTQDNVIRQQLLFQTGDLFRPKTLIESERLLRDNPYLKEALITATALCDHLVQINVAVQDSWTLIPSASIGSAGGKSESGLSLQEHNLFGLGKGISLKYNKDSERASTLLAYKDTQLFGSRKQLLLSFQDNTDGKGYEFDLSLPFYASETEIAWGVNSVALKQENSVYTAGEVIKKIGQEGRSHTAFYGWGNQTEGQRFKVGWSYHKKQYLSLAERENSPLLSSLTESYPWFQLENYNDNFITKTNFRTMGRTEDISLGRRLSVNIGLLAQQLGSDDNYLRVASTLSRGKVFNQNNLGFIELKTTHYIGEGVSKGGQTSLKGEWYAYDNKDNNFYVSTTLEVANNQLEGEQTLLGGEYGLRGYPLGYQTGDKSITLSAEKRVHFDWYPFNLAKFGGVAFVDIGSAWGKGNEARLLSDVGFGLRIVPTRSSSSNIFHLDIAFPLNDLEKVDQYQLVIRGSKTF